MGAQDTRPSWWHTFPGILTGVAGMITAITGLLVVVQRSGTFRSDPDPPRTRSTVAARAQRETSPSPGVESKPNSPKESETAAPPASEPKSETPPPPAETSSSTAEESAPTAAPGGAPPSQGAAAPD